MSRAGYSDDCDSDGNWGFIMWRGAVASAVRGKRGQAFLRELLTAMDALPEPKLIAKELEQNGAVCALGAVGKARGMEMAAIDPYDYERVAPAFGIAEALTREIVYENDEVGTYRFWNSCYWPTRETPEERFQRMRRWVVSKLRPAA